MSAGGWNTIESDAGVFTELVEKLKIQKIQFEELYSIDQSTLEALKPLYGVIFLFKYGDVDRSTEPLDGEYDFSNESIFFAKQKISNACATQAVLNVLLNRDDIDLGEEVSNFKEFVGTFDSDLKGETISNSDLIRQIHNSFSSPNSFIDDSKEPYEPDEDDDGLYHFIGYVRTHGYIYELDGLKNAPIKHSACANDDEFAAQLPAILQRRISRYREGELRFSVLAIVKDRRDVYLEIGDQDGYQQELLKREAWARENELRRHDLVGLVHQINEGIASLETTEDWNKKIRDASERGRLRAEQRKLWRR